MKYFKIIIVASILVSFALFVKGIEFESIVAGLRQVGYKFIFLIATTFLAYYAATIGWKYCLSKRNHIVSDNRLFLIRHLGETLALINPGSIVGGDALKFYLLKQKGAEPTNVLSSLVISRILMIITQLLMFIVAAVFFLPRQGFLQLTQGLGKPLLIGLCSISALVLLIVVLRKLLAGKGIIPVSAKLNERLKRWAEKLASIRRSFLKFVVHERKAMVMATLWFLLHWFFGAFEFYLILKFMNIPCTVGQAIFLDMGVIFFKAAGAFVPAQIGVEEYGNKVMLEMIGVQGGEVWITVSVLRRARQVFWLLMGLAIYVVVQKKWKLSLRKQ